MQNPPIAVDAQERAVRLALIILFLGVVGISFAPIFVRLSPVGPVATAFYRLLFALPLLTLWMNREGKREQTSETRRPRTTREYGRLLVAGLFFAADLSVWHWSIQFTAVANATLFGNFASLFVTLGAWLMFGDRITRTFLLGLILALAGAAGMMAESLSFSGDHLFGDLLAIGAAVFYAGYLLSIKSLRADFSAATVMTWSGIGACAALLIIAGLSGESLIASGLAGWAVLLGVAWVSHVGGQGLIAYSFRHLPASFGSVSLLLQPVLAAMLAWALLSEPLSVWQSVSGLVVLSGIVLARRGSRLNG